MRNVLISFITFVTFATFAHASVSHRIVVDTTSLVGHSAGPFYLAFQLIDGDSIGDGNNAIELREFAFSGGGPAGVPVVTGSSDGDLISGIVLTDAEVPKNTYLHAFTPGSSVAFTISSTEESDTGDIPDSFIFSILDRLGNGIPTTEGSPLGVLAEVLFDADGATIKVFNSDPAKTPTAGGPPLHVVTTLLALPTVTWAAPEAIVFGTPLGTTQLNASATIPGKFVYTPDFGTVLNPGSDQILKVTFTPDDTDSYAGVTKMVTIDVLNWTLTGFYPPVDPTTSNTIVWNTVKEGSTVPFKFNIYAGKSEQTDLSAVQMFEIVEVPCVDSTLPDAPIDVQTAGETHLRYDADSHQFVQNLKIPKQASQCYSVRMTALDGSTIKAFFKTR